MDHGLKQINYGTVIGNIFNRDTRQTLGAHQSTTIGGFFFHTRGSFTGDRWRQLTPLVKIMTRTTIAQSNLSVSPAVVNPSFSVMSTRAGESVATSASAKQEPDHCAAMIATKNTDIDYHTVPPPEYQAGGASKREDLRFSKSN